MGALFLAALLTSEAIASSEPVYPEPAFFLPLARRDFGVEGWVRCLEARVNHFGLGTDQPVHQVIDGAVVDCEVVRNAAEKTMMQQGSDFRAKVEKDAPGRFDDNWFEAKIPELLSDLEKNFKISAAAALSEERSSENYDPTAYMAKYRQDAETGNLPRFSAQ